METASSFGKLCGNVRRERVERVKGRGSAGVRPYHLPNITGSLLSPGTTELRGGQGSRLLALPCSAITQFIPPSWFVVCKSDVAYFVINAKCNSK